MANILITGASGYIGSHLVNTLQKYKKYELFFASRKKKNNSSKQLYLDQKYKNLFFKKIILLGFNNDLIEYNQFPEKTLKKNIIYFEKLIKFILAHSNKNTQVIFTSSASILGSKKDYINKDININILSFYDLNKVYAENVLEYNSSKGKNYNLLILRLTNVYGLSDNKSIQKNRGFINKVIDNIINKKKIFIYGDGNYTRNFIHISDVISAILLAIRYKKLLNKKIILNSTNNLKLIDMIYKISNIAKNELSINANISFKKIDNTMDISDFRDFFSKDNTFSKITNWKISKNLDIELKEMILKKYYDYKKKN